METPATDYLKLAGLKDYPALHQAVRGAARGPGLASLRFPAVTSEPGTALPGRVSRLRELTSAPVVPDIQRAARLRGTVNYSPGNNAPIDEAVGRHREFSTAQGSFTPEAHANTVDANVAEAAYTTHAENFRDLQGRRQTRRGQARLKGVTKDEYLQRAVVDPLWYLR